MKLNSLSLRISLLFLAGILALTCVRANAQSKQQNSAQKSTDGSSKFAAKEQAAANQAAEKDTDSEQGAKGNIEKDSPELIRKRDEWFYKQRASVNGHIPAGARQQALQHMQRMMQAEGKLVQRPNGSFAELIPAAAPVTNTWTTIGPTPTTGGIDFSPVTGRVTTIAIDPSDATGNTVLIGGAQGGIWRTTDGGNTWTAVGDQNASLAMGSIAFAPSAPKTVYAGTGEQASIGFDIYYGAGVLKSTDGGQTWATTCAPNPNTCPFAGPFSNQSPFGFFTLGGTRTSYVAVNPANAQMVLVGAQTQFAEGSTEGVYCTDNGGSTWSLIATASGEMSTFVGFASSSVAFAALGNPFGTQTGKNGIYKSINANGTCSTITFSQLTSGLPSGTSVGRIDLGISPNFAADNTVYASIADGLASSTTNLGVWVTTNGGTSWTQTTAPDVCQAQCWYDNVIKVDPTNGKIAFFGGAAVTSAGNPIWVVRTTDGGQTWATVIPNQISPGLPHVDNHAMAFVKLAGGVRMYLGNDGGIWRTDNAEAAAVTWTNLNDSTLTLTQFYPALSINPSSPQVAYAGAQDNGSQIYSGNPNWVDNQICGDGTGTAIDNVIPTTVVVACNGLNLGLSVQNGQPGTFVAGDNGISAADNSDFVPPIVSDPSQANTFYAGSTKVYQSVDGSNSYIALSGNLVNQGALTALAVAPKNSSVIYAGADSGLIFVATNVTTGSGTFAAVIGQSSLPPRTVRAIAVDPADATGKTAYAAFSGFSFVQGNINDPKGHLFKTTDGGATWTDISCTAMNCSTPAATDLPNTPINDVVLDPDLPGTIYVGTDVGVFLGSCATLPCSWSTLSTGLPRAAVLSLKLHEPSRTLFAATHGRGVWTIVVNNFTFPAGPHISSLNPTSATAGANQLLTVNGSGLTGGKIQLNGSAVTTTGVSDSQLTANLSALVAGTQSVTVVVSGTPSNALTFSVLAGAPTIAASTPGNANVNANTATLTVTGTGFTSKSQVVLNPDVGGTPIATTFTDAQHLSAMVPASFMANFGSTNSVGVRNPAPGGGTTVTTNVVTLPTFVVVAPPPVNDNFASPVNITSTSFSDTKDSSGATTQPNDPAPPCAQNPRIPFTTGISNTIWYKVTPSGSGSANIDTIGSSYDSVLSVWTGASQTALTNVACNDDINPGIIIQSQLTNVPLSAGTTYFIMVSSFGQADPNPIAFGGKSVLNFSFTGTIGGGGGGSFTVSGTATTVTAGSNNTSTITVTPSGGFTGTVAVTCGSLPGVTCNALNVNVPNGGGNGSGSLTINVAAPSSSTTAMALPSTQNLWAASHPASHRARNGWWTLSGGTGLAAILLLLLPKRKRYRAALGLGLVCILSFTLGCGGGYGGGGGGGGGGAVNTTTAMTVSSTKLATTGTLTVSATVTDTTSGRAPTGSVQFFDGNTALGNPVPISNGTTGQIMLTAASAPPLFQLIGTHTVTAHYQGDAYTNPSQSGALNITITGTTNLAITGTSGATMANANISLTIN